jgi:hypothetical protein
VNVGGVLPPVTLGYSLASQLNNLCGSLNEPSHILALLPKQQSGRTKQRDDQKECGKFAHCLCTDLARPDQAA